MRRCPPQPCHRCVKAEWAGAGPGPGDRPPLGMRAVEKHLGVTPRAGGVSTQALPATPQLGCMRSRSQEHLSREWAEAGTAGTNGQAAADHPVLEAGSEHREAGSCRPPPLVMAVSGNRGVCHLSDLGPALRAQEMRARERSLHSKGFRLLNGETETQEETVPPPRSCGPFSLTCL